jgi:DNA-binding HxlR family transcriptional regulator
MLHAPLKSHCPINFALETFGDKWSLLIVRDMVFYGKHTYGEFLASKEGIATNVLADRLTMLGREAILKKQPHPSDKRKEVYTLTPKGLSLIPILLQIEAWSTRHDPQTTGSKAFAQQIENDLQATTRRATTLVRTRQQTYCLTEEL